MKFPLYRLPTPADAIDQGDIIDGCPVLFINNFNIANLETLDVKGPLSRVVVLTQTCDLANEKIKHAVCAVVYEAAYLVERQLLKAEQVRGQVRTGQIFGWYYLPASAALELPEMIVDFRQLHTVRMDLLTALCQRGQRKARVQPLYREHLAK